MQVKLTVCLYTLLHSVWYIVHNEILRKDIERNDMSKKSNSGGLFALLTGAALGAAAVFFSNKKNRDVAKNTISTAKKKYKDNPKKAVADVKKIANQKVKEVKAVAKKKLAKSVATSAGTVSKRASSVKKQATKTAKKA